MVWSRLRVPGRNVLRFGGAADALEEDEGGTETPFTGFFGIVLVGIWLVYLADPILRAWQHRDEARGDLVLVALAAFAVLYLDHFWLERRYILRPTRVSGSGWVRAPASLARWLAMAGLATLATVILGQEAGATWVFVAVAGLWTFRVPIGHVISVVLVVLYEFLSLHLDTWHHDASVSFAIILAVTAVTGGMVAGQRQFALAEARQENALLALQEERNRMARDVHDILGHSLTVITVKAELATRLIDVSPDRARSEIADLERLSRDALADVRKAVEGYREISLSGELARAREALAAARISADVSVTTDEVPPDMREVCAWAVREGVTNVIRHSGATRCTISLGRTGVTITDDGVARPAEVEVAERGHGLVGLRERAATVGAVVTAGSVRPHGFRLAVLAGGDSAAERSDDEQGVRT
jgi:two-component system sensor histidine kinase DesK